MQGVDGLIPKQLILEIFTMVNSSKDWFERDIKYSGLGRAEFSNPHIILEGPTRVEFKESGEHDIQMQFTDINGEVEPDVLDLFNRLSSNGRVSTNEFAHISRFFNDIETNQCTKIEVKTSSGIFSSIGSEISHYSPNFNNILKFFVLNSQFETENKKPKYWVLPLYNFLTNFYRYSHNLINLLSINSKHIGLIFKFNSNTCFIEPLNNYHVMKKQLISFQSQKRLTALMTGELKSNQIDFDSLNRQVPINFLELLGLAVGTEVGSPWVEFRTADRELAKRIHIKFNNPIYFKGHIAIDDFCQQGIEKLLTQGQSLLHIGNSYMIAILKHCIHANSINLTIDEKLTHLFQALDCFCEIFNFKTQNLNQSLNTSQQDGIYNILKTARLDIIKISHTAGDNRQSQVIKKIAERTSSNPASTTRDFGLCLVDLLNLFDLPDANILEEYYQKKGKSWIDYISHCRGVEIHKGYLDFYEGEFSTKEIIIIKAHLHDILLRLIFKMVYYNGTYESPIGRTPNPKSVDWIKPNTSPKELGY